jgi:hypothetical protein
VTIVTETSRATPAIENVGKIFELEWAPAVIGNAKTTSIMMVRKRLLLNFDIVASLIIYRRKDRPAFLSLAKLSDEKKLF